MNLQIHRTSFFLLICLLSFPGFLPIRAFAQNEPLKFTSITSMDGLSSNTVASILKDRYGYIWIATEDGLNKFDGSEFTVYRHNKHDTTSLKSNDVSVLHEDLNGRLWVGTIEGSLHLYNRKKDSFQRIRTNHSITAICSDQNNRLWLATTTGLITVDPVTLEVSKFASRPGVPTEMADGLIFSLFKDRSKRIWIGTQNGLYLWNSKENSFEPIAYQSPVTEVGNNTPVRTISEDKSGNMWIGTFNGLSKLTPQGKHLQTFRYDPQDDQTISSNMVYATAAENEEKLWICTDSGLNIMDIKSGQVVRYAPDARAPFSLTNKSIRTILIDQQGIFWLGTYKGGVNKYDKNLTIFGLKRSDPHDRYGLSAPFVTSFAETDHGDLFVGTDGGGLNLYDRKTNLCTLYPIYPQRKMASSGLAILSLEMSSPEHLWIGTFQDGLFSLNTRTGRYEQFTRGTDPKSLSSSDIFCLKTDRKGKLWIGTNGGGVNVFDPVKHEFTRYYDSKTALPQRILPLNAYIRAIEEDRHGNIWIGSYGTGIVVFNPEKQKSTLYVRENSNLPSNRIISIHEDLKGNIWVGTNGEGLAMFNPDTQKFSVFAEKEGLPSGIVHKVLEDAQGRIWVTTNQGVSFLDLKKKRFTNYTSYNGLQNNTFVLGAGLRTTDNTLFFGGIEGFNYLNTKALKSNNNNAPVILKDFRVGNKTITAADSSIIKEHISIAKSINLDYKQNFSISYAVLNYTNPQQTNFRYRLQGFEQEWNNAGFVTTANYTNLSPGEYTFEVQASDNNGVWSGKGASIEIFVKPPFYMTIYAYVFYGMTCLASLLLLRRRGIQKLQNKFREEQQKREIERSHELDQMKIKFLTNLSHEFRTPISLILAPLENVLSRTTSTGEFLPQLHAIKRNAKRLLNLVDQLLDFRNLQGQEQKLDLTRNEIVSFVRERSDSFRDLSQKKDITFNFNSEVDRLDMHFDADKVERILFNLLSNAFKFTRSGGVIMLDLASEVDASGQHWFCFKVSDTGVGIPADKRDKIFERFFQDDSLPSVLNQGSGIGLSIVKEFVQMHGGLITVESEPGEGSTFSVSLPYEPSSTTEPSEQSSAPPIVDNESLEISAASNHARALDQEYPNILIVEDNDEFRHHLRDNLKPYYKVFEATDGRIGWQKVLAHHPELIVSDIAMPHMDGIQLSRKIKSDKRTSHIPIILLTASVGEEQQLRGLSSGANDYLTKPFSFEILNAKINNLLLLNRLLKTVYSRHIKISGSETQIESGDEKLLKDILFYIEANLNNDQLSVENLSKHVGMSRGTLYNKILEITEQTPIEFIRSIKLEKAALLLEKSDLNVSQISYTAGFATPNYFAKSFKAKFNMLPSEYKNRKRKIPDETKA